METQTESAAGTMLLATFSVADALCGLDASGIQEVIRIESVTPVRHAPEEVTGVINLRGKIVTVLDLGRILGSGKTVITRQSRVFILEDRGEFIGLLADRVGEVVEVERAQEGTLPVNIPAAQARLIRGICRIGDEVVAVLNESEVLCEARSAVSGQTAG